MADYIITINDEMSAYFPNKTKQALIPLGIDTAYYDTKKVAKTKAMNPDKFHIITVANLVPVKGIEILLEAMAILQDSGIQLSVLGDCENAYGLNMMLLTEHLGLQEQVKFLGKQLDVRPTLDAGRKEGMPMALVEAMSMGIPVLGSHITGINYVLKAFPELLFPAGNAEVLAEKMKQLKATDPIQRLALGKRLRTYCETHFTMEAFIAAHEALYKTL